MQLYNITITPENPNEELREIQVEAEDIDTIADAIETALTNNKKI